MDLAFKIDLAGRDSVYMRTDKFESPSADRLSLDEILAEVVMQDLLDVETVELVHEVNEIPLWKYESET